MLFIIAKHFWHTLDMRAKQLPPQKSLSLSLSLAFLLLSQTSSPLAWALFSCSPSFCSWNILFLLWANRFDVALCLIPFQACSCFGNGRKKIPITNQIKAHSMKRNWKQQASKSCAHEMALFWLSTQLKSETHYHNLKQPSANTRQMVGNNPCIINR